MILNSKEFRVSGGFRDSDEKETYSWVWWVVPVIPALERQRGVDPCKFIGQGLIVTSSFFVLKKRKILPKKLIFKLYTAFKYFPKLRN